MKHKNPDCGNVEIGEGNCPRCWRDSFTCDDKGHHFAENAEICDCRKLTRVMAESEVFTDSEGYEAWTDCEKHGAQKGVKCPKCKTSEQVWNEAIDESKRNRNAILAYEVIALMFYNDTGIMAPGKSVSPVMIDSRYQDGTRESAWEKWQELNRKHIKAVYNLLVPKYEE